MYPHCLGLLVIIALCNGLSAQEIKKDALGDSMPKGAIARLGSGRLLGQRFQFSPDGKAVLYETPELNLALARVPDGEPLATFLAKDIPDCTYIIGYTASFSPDGKFVAAIGWDGGAGLWETATGKFVRHFPDCKFYSITRAVFSPDGKILVLGRRYEVQKPRQKEQIELTAYAVDTGKALFTMPGSVAAFSDDGTCVHVHDGYRQSASGFGPQTLITYKLADPEKPSEVSLSTYIDSDAPRVDGKECIIEVNSQSGILVADRDTKVEKHWLEGPSRFDKQTRIQLRRPMGQRNLFASQNVPGKVWSWNLDTGKKNWEVEHEALNYPFLVSADGGTVVLWPKGGDVQVLDTKTGKLRSKIDILAVGHNSLQDISRDGKILVTKLAAGNNAAKAIFWDTATGKRLGTPQGHAAQIIAIEFAPDGKTIYTASRDGTLRSWDMAGKELKQQPLKAGVVRIVDGKVYYTDAEKQKELRVLDLATGKIGEPWTPFKSQVYSFVVSADSKIIVAHGTDDAMPTARDHVRVLDAATGKQLAEFSTDGDAERIATSSDGSVVAVSLVKRGLCLWQKSTGKVQVVNIGSVAKQQNNEPYQIGSLAVSSDGGIAVFTDQVQGLGIIDTAKAKLVGHALLPGDHVFKLPDLNGWQDGITISPDGKFAAWGNIGGDDAVALVNLAEAKFERWLQVRNYGIKLLRFSPDGKTLFTTAGDGSAMLWNWPSMKE